MSKAEEIKNILEKYPQYQESLFTRGYLITNKEIKNLNSYPFYGNWNFIKHSNCYKNLNLFIYTHRLQELYIYEEDDVNMVMIGHAYNPITMEYNEKEILKDCIKSYKKSKASYFDKISELTGVHLILLSNKDNLIVFQDCCGFMPVYYGKIHELFYLSSHAQLVADLCDLKMSDKINKYINTQFYKIGISQLCGLDSPFDEMTMLSPNTYLEMPDFKIERFYPIKSIESASNNFSNAIKDILTASLKLCARKWDCSISLSGGLDSKMTLAAANNSYDKFKYFSFISSDAENKDALAAHKICSNLGLKHTIYNIPEEKSEIKDFEIIASIMNHNQAYIRKKYSNDSRKRAYLKNNASISVEIKSHASEVGRAFYYKKLGKTKFKLPLTPRNMSNLAKRNFFNRVILKDMDSSFKRFINITKFGEFPEGYDETDLFYWENRLPAWGALVKQSFDIAYETTIIYNNRKLLELFLSFPLNERITDKPQKKIIYNLNSHLLEMNININNFMKNWKRICLERIFFELNSLVIGKWENKNED